MSQTAYNFNMATAFAGMKADSRFDLVESAAAFLAIPFGRAVASEAGEEDVHIPVRDVTVLTFSGDFGASNVITVTVNGVACAPITYAVAHANTATALLAAIAAHPAVTSASKNGAGRIYTIETKAVAASSSALVVGGATVTATAEELTGMDEVFRGISLHRHNETGAYVKKDIVDVLRQGVVWVETAVAVTADDPVYVDMAGGLGKFTNSSTNNLATGGKFRSTVGGAGLAKVEINLP
jgi:hypothetical protein